MFHVDSKRLACLDRDGIGQWRPVPWALSMGRVYAHVAINAATSLNYVCFLSK
jgi:hypothetical protein